MAAPIQYNDMANFPLGVRSFGTPLLGETTGRIFFVDSSNTANKGDDGNHGNTPQAPFATIDYAIGQCSANRGDIIKVLPGHTETVTTASFINLDVAGVTIEGLGSGRDRPTLTYSSSTAASIDFNADNCLIRNLVLDMTGINSVGQGGGSAGGVRILAANCTLTECEIILATTGNQVKTAIGLSSAAVRAKILGNLLSGTPSTGPNYAIFVYGAGAATVDGIEIGWNRISGSFAVCCIEVSFTDVLTNAFIHDNILINYEAAQECLRITVGTGSSGIVANNKMVGTSLTDLYAGTAIGIANIENYGYDIDTTGLLGVPLPIVGTTLPVDTSLLDQILSEFDYRHANYLQVEVDFSSGTWNTVATHELLTVSGRCRLIIVPVCTTDLTTGGTAYIAFQDEDGIELVSTTLATDIDADRVWLSPTVAKTYVRSQVVDIVTNGADLGVEITGAALTGGIVQFNIWWSAFDSTGSIAAGAGGVL